MTSVQPPRLGGRGDLKDKTADLMADDWREQALCAGDARPDDWHPGQVFTASNELAAAICTYCPVREACLAFAIDAPRYGGIAYYGIWGGTTRTERQGLRRRLTR